MLVQASELEFSPPGEHVVVCRDRRHPFEPGRQDQENRRL